MAHVGQKFTFILVRQLQFAGFVDEYFRRARQFVLLVFEHLRLFFQLRVGLFELRLLRFEVSYGKAYAALAMGRESRQVLQKAKDKPLFMQSFVELADGPMFLEGGGQLIRDKDGEVIGAIATTGDTNEVDDLCAIAGIRAAGFKTDHDFSDSDMRRLNIKRGVPVEDPEKAKPAAQLKRV